MYKVITIAVGLTLSTAAQAQSYVTTPDGFGGSFTTGPNGWSATTLPDRFGGSSTTVNPGYEPLQPQLVPPLTSPPGYVQPGTYPQPYRR